jgi:predicted Fe-Mo cluster-binding NifX family protein
MLIAVATDDGKHIAQHFGRCAFFSIWKFDEGGQPASIGLRVNTFTAQATGGEAGLPDLPIAPPPGEVPGESPKDFHLPEPAGKGKGQPRRGMLSHASVLEGLADVQVVIAAGMGRRIVNDLNANNKEIFVTQETGIASAVDKYIEGTLTSGESCSGDH